MDRRLQSFRIALGGLLVALATLFAAAPWAPAAIVSDVRNTKHNLGTTGPGPVRATTESQICVFCHTPHAATAGQAPLWNRRLSTATYTRVYDSSSLDSKYIASAFSGQPGGSSKLCLSCHDGTMAIGNVGVLNGLMNQTTGINIPMSGTATAGTGTVAGGMPAGSGVTSGFTRNLGVELHNDHPISVTYNATVANADGELRVPDGSQRVGGTFPATGFLSRFNQAVGLRNNPAGTRPEFPLEPTGASGAGQIQCASCHDPHVRDTSFALPAGGANPTSRFLRGNRFQQTQPQGSTYNAANDIMCLACHDKAGLSYAYSTHANSLVALETFRTGAPPGRVGAPDLTQLLGFPANLPVWQASCLNCHDAHTVSGARRLLREGTNTAVTGGIQVGTAFGTGGFPNSAIEQTCYQCHTVTGETLLSASGSGTDVPDIKSDFNIVNGKRMPIATSPEVHDIGGNFNDAAAGGADCTVIANTRCGKDMIESKALLGITAGNRHAECTDCHNPHRVVKFQQGIRASLVGTPDKAGTHRHENLAGYIHTNLISGVLRGTWGVEPVYSDPSFQVMPATFTVKRGDPGTSADTAATAPHVTREYQVCLKCHSNFAYTDDNVYPNGAARPLLGHTGGLTTPADIANRYTRYTNQAKEFQAPNVAPNNHAVPTGSVNLGFNGGAGPLPAGNAATNNNNHRSWHPVLAPTGRVNRPGAFLAPWNNTGTGGQAGRLGVQTMYCSDCHGTNTAAGTAIPTGNTSAFPGTAADENGNPWGPHGSANTFILKGTWDTGSGEGQANTVCFKCHDAGAYSGGGGTGFQTDKGDGHNVHSQRIDTPMKCNFCHIAVPHGWKNRSLLVNLNDVGPEAGLARGTAVTFTNNVGYTNGPYYRNAFARITSFPSGQWTETNCNGGRDGMKTQCETPP